MTDITASSVAIICPTKNQPEKVRRLLRCIAALDEKPGQVIIADGGHNLKPIVEPFNAEFSLMCLYCPEAGQILQRNYAHTFLNEDISVVIHLDDDITVEQDFISVFLATWTRERERPGKPLAGLSFNLVDLPTIKNSLFRRAFFLSVVPPGRVSQAGYAAPFCPADRDLEVSWLLGGATAWSRDILEAYRHPLSFPTRWAVCEDLIYSYPLSKEFRMLVSQQIKCRHNETYSKLGFKKSIFYGRSSILFRYLFIERHDELSSLAWLWMSIGIFNLRLIRGIYSKHHLGFAIGMMFGLIDISINKFLDRDIEYAARDMNSKY